MQPERRDDANPPMLLAGGDWACAHCNPNGLAVVAQQLRTWVGEEERRALLEVERLVDVDMLQASELWSRATHRLRERYFGADPFAHA